MCGSKQEFQYWEERHYILIRSYGNYWLQMMLGSRAITPLRDETIAREDLSLLEKANGGDC